MKMKKIYAALFLMPAVLGLVSCSDDEWNSLGEGKVELTTSHRAFILNEGSMNQNNSSITYFDWSATGDSAAVDLYATQNGKKLGDTGNDIEVVDNNRVVVAINVSNYVALLDGYGIEKSRISFEKYKNLGQVRNVAVEGDTVYAVSYGGYISRISMKGNKLEYVDSLKVGDRPEDVVKNNGKLYVTLQGADYKDNRVAIVSNFKTINYAEVMQDPARLYADGDKIYVTGFGASYYENPWGVLDTKTNTYTQIGNASSITLGNGVIYAANSVTDWDTYAVSTTLFTYTIADGKENTSYFQNVPAAINSNTVYSVSYNKYNQHVYFITSDYVNDGIVYEFDEKGAFVRQFSAGGVNSHGICFLN